MVVVLGALLGACSNPGADEAAALVALEAQSSAVHTSITEAVSTAQAAGASSGAALDAAQRAGDAVAAFEEAARREALTEEVERAAHFLADSSRAALDLLAAGDPDGAAALTTTVLADDIAALRGQLSARRSELGPDAFETGGPNVGLIAGIVVTAILAAGLARAKRTIDARREGPDKPVHAETAPGPAHEPVVTTSPAPPSVANDSGAAPQVRMVAASVPLAQVVEIAVESMEHGTWEVAMDVAPVHVFAEPLKLRRLLNNLLLNATALHASHVGILGEIEGERVILTVGSDSVFETEHPHGTVPPEIDHQLTFGRQLMEPMGARIDWELFEGVSIFTIDLELCEADEDDTEGEVSRV
jgi:hypothetical protein